MSAFHPSLPFVAPLVYTEVAGSPWPEADRPLSCAKPHILPFVQRNCRCPALTRPLPLLPPSPKATVSRRLDHLAMKSALPKLGALARCNEKRMTGFARIGSVPPASRHNDELSGLKAELALRCFVVED